MLPHGARVRKDARERVDISTVCELAFEKSDREVEQPVCASVWGRLLRGGVGVRSEDASESGSAWLQSLDHLAQEVSKLCAEFVDGEGQVLDNAVDVVSDRGVWLVVYILDVGHADNRLNRRKLLKVDPTRLRRDAELTRFVAGESDILAFDVKAPASTRDVEEASIRCLAMKLELRR